MNKREMAKKLRGWGRIEINHQQLTNEVAEAAASALEREADAEEKAKPKVTLHAQARVVDLMRRDTESGLVSRVCPGSTIASTMISELAAAADTLRRLDEEGGKLRKRHSNSADYDNCTCTVCNIFRSLGVEPKP